MSNYVDVFGGTTLPPSEFKAQTLALTADASLFWPYNYTGTGNIVAKLNSLTSTGAYNLTFPDATQVSNGEDSLWINNSAFTITLKDSTGGVIGTVAAGVSKYVFLKDNSTAAGTWAIFTYGTGTSAADASALAGYGLKATSTTISQAIPLTETSLAVIVSATTSRAQAYVFTGGSTTCTFPSAVTAGADFFFYVKNGGTGTITLTPVGGDQVDNVSSLGLNPQESCIVFSSGNDWHTIGLGRSTIYQFTKLVKDLTGISSYTLTSSDASNKLLQFTGAPSGATTITVPAVVAIYYVEISTSNAFTVTLKTAAGAGVTIAQNARSILYCDGVNVVSAQTASTPAAQTTITNDTTTNASVYPTWVTAGTGDLPTYVSTSKYSFNPSTGMLTVTAITSNLTGTASAVPLGGITGLGTGVATALAVNVGSAGAPVVLNGALGTPSSGTLTNVSGLPPAGVVGTAAILGANTFTAAQRITATALGNISNATVTFDWTAADVQTYTATGSTVTWAFSNAPASGTFGEMLIVATAQGTYTLAAGTTVNWEKLDGTYTTSLTTYLAQNGTRTALSAGVDNFYLWSTLGVIYGKLV